MNKETSCVWRSGCAAPIQCAAAGHCLRIPKDLADTQTEVRPSNQQSDLDRLQRIREILAEHDKGSGRTVDVLLALRYALRLSDETTAHPSDALKTMRDMLHVAQRAGCLVTLTAEQCKEVIREMERGSPEEPSALPHGFVMVAQCASCCVQDFPGARHHSQCACNPGELVRPEKARTPLRDSDAAFSLGVLPTEQPEKATERRCDVCQVVNVHEFLNCANCGLELQPLGDG